MKVLHDYVIHRSLRIIKRSGNHADERNCHIIYHLICSRFCPLHFFQSMDTLEIDRIRISTLQASRFERSMEIYQQFVFCSGFSRFTVKLNYLLVVTVHKINLETFDSHCGIMLTYTIHVFFKSTIARPKYQIYIFAFCIANQLFQIDFRNHLKQIRFTRHCPSLIQYHIFDTEFRGKVNIVFISLIVDTCAEIHVVEIPVVPPVPSHFTRFNPRKICKLRRSSQFIYHIIAKQFCILLGNDHDTPGKCCVSLHFSNIGFTRFYYPFQPANFVYYRFRISCKDSIQRISMLTMFHIHTRIVHQIGFSDTDFLSVLSLDQNR